MPLWKLKVIDDEDVEIENWDLLWINTYFFANSWNYGIWTLSRKPRMVINVIIEAIF